MGQILGLGMTEFPAFRFSDDAKLLEVFDRAQSRIPSGSRYVERSNWPAPMLAELGDDEGAAAARGHRTTLVSGFRRLRDELDAFAPDAVILCLEDHYENFHQDIIPPYCLLAYEDFTVRPYTVHGEARFDDNVWQESTDTTWTVPGARALGVKLASALSKEGVEIPISFEPLHGAEVAHPFAGAFRYLDWDSEGFDYPSLLLHVNAYGSREIASRYEMPTDSATGRPLEIPPPSPRGAFDLGRALGRALRDHIGERIAVVAGSSWSHASLAPGNDYFFPDVAADRARFDELEQGRFADWAKVDQAQMDTSGQVEMLTWYPLVGLLDEIRPTCRYLEFVPTYLFNSTKVLAVYGG